MSNDLLSSVTPDARGASGHGRPVKVAAATINGKGLPPNGGREPPPVQLEPVKVPRPPDLSRMVEKLNEFLRQSARDVQLRYDDGSGRTVITVIDAATGDVVRQIPSEELLAMAARMRAASQAGTLLDLTA